MFSFSTISKAWRLPHTHRSTVVWAKFMPAGRKDPRGRSKTKALKVYGASRNHYQREHLYEERIKQPRKEATICRGSGQKQSNLFPADVHDALLM